MSKRFDKKKAQTFALVHRSHEDELFHDPDASERVLVPVQNRNQVKRNQKIQTTRDLEVTLHEEIQQGKIRPNEGEAAVYGITYDDSKYDYMQHLRPIGGTDGVFIAKKGDQPKEKKQGLLFKEELKDILPSEQNQKPNYQAFQNVPDAIAGFKPDMDPKLREVLEALEDEAYVEDDEEIFGDLLASGEAGGGDDYDEDEDWDLDNYEDEYDARYDSDNHVSGGEEGAPSGWERDFKKFEAMNKNKVNDWDSDDDFEDEEDDIIAPLPTFGETGTKKISKTKLRKKKGAMTDLSSFSMTSSALFRTEGLTLLDDKHEQLMKKYEQEDDEEESYEPFKMENQRPDFEDMLDDFLDNYELEKGGRKVAKKDPEIEKLKIASDSVSKGKVAVRRKKERAAKDSSLGGLDALKNLKI